MPETEAVKYLAAMTSQGETASAQREAAACPAARILLAEDNLVNQMVVLKQLSRLGYDADAAANGEEVLEALQRRDYDVILMDCQMPSLDGYETTQRIRREKRQSIHIIAMSAHSMDGNLEKCLAAGMDDYLSKPARMGDIRAALDRFAQQKLQSRAGLPPATLA